MKLLFVCWANVGRSQMAAAFYNKFTSSNNAYSAGTAVEKPGETLLERKSRRGGTAVIEAMDEEGIDIRGSEMTQVTPDMIESYDKVICMAQPEHTPSWLESTPQFVRWDVEDPGGKDYAATIIARDIIKAEVQSLLNEQ